MAILASCLYHLPHFLPKTSRRRSIGALPIRSRLEAHDNMEFSQTSSSQSELQSSDVWQLFTEAQQNILYLNKQRMVAVEELNKAKEEIQTLHQRIENLEAGKHEYTGGDKSSILWEVLLRIDSMVLTGLIDGGDASDLRRLVMDSKVSFPDDVVPLLQKRDAELLAELRRLSRQSKRSGFHVVHVCTEMEPVVSVGSLGSYVTGISRALQRKGNLVEVILPKYKSLDLTMVQGLQEIQSEFYSYFNGQLHGNKIWTGVVYGIGVTFLEPLYYSSLFNREMVYGYSDEFERFTYFSRASLDYLVKVGKHPDVIHIHNWETAIIGPLFWDIFINQGLSATRILLTCQDFASQCLEQPEKLALCGLDPSRLNRPDRLQDHSKAHLVNILKGGIIYSNKVIFLSSINSKGRILWSPGHGLEPTLSSHKDKLVVAPYGFDQTMWDPSRDELLPENFSVSDMKGKGICKSSLQQHVGLSEDASSILVGCIVSEISDVDLESLLGFLRLADLRGIQFLFMGVSRLPSIDNALQSLSEELELKAIRYGAAPILVTSIERRFRHFVEHDFGSTQFFKYISAFSNMSLMQAVDEIRNMPSEWSRKIEEAMLEDFTWDAECYNVHISAYESLKNL
ncbi:probable starch synthase 4, chloroplastic/amyloplastic isoform X4 [Beta vulgaris subsp. vulgaris]|uniref:probable starch synthase 4, chloroplastic/amyloplastic isoform X4 n=1 Tax=Beta vulgaris subsp. vulgaris TaxID=3555 RepID=UPI00053FDDE5|nr:probable starch synthase 4, chloroplastic/amyloplastic isoform X4 [Beta vulgaris subsp. vulgaris]